MVNIRNMKHNMGRVFKNGPSEICGRQPLKKLLGPFLNTLPNTKHWQFFLKLPGNVLLKTHYFKDLLVTAHTSTTPLCF